MSTEVKHRRGTAAQHATFTGAEAEITYDSTNKTLRVHDATTTGGIVIARKDQTGMGVGAFSGLASVTPDQVAVGETVRVIETGAVYQRVSTGGDLDYTGTGGLRLSVVVGAQSLAPEAFSALGNGSANDAAAFVNARAKGIALTLLPGKTYRISSSVTLGKLMNLGGVISIDAGVTVTYDDVIGPENVVCFSGAGIARSASEKYSLGHYSGASANEKWDFLRRAFVTNRLYYCRVPAPVPTDLAYHGPNAWKVTAPLVFDDPENAGVFDCDAAFYVTSATTIASVFHFSPVNKTEDIRFPQGLRIECNSKATDGIYIQGGARLIFDAEVVVGYPRRDGVNMSDMIAASDEVQFKFLRSVGYGRRVLTLYSNNIDRPILGFSVDYLFSNGGSTGCLGVTSIGGNVRQFRIEKLLENFFAPAGLVDGTDCLVEFVVSAGGFVPNRNVMIDQLHALNSTSTIVRVRDETGGTYTGDGLKAQITQVFRDQAGIPTNTGFDLKFTSEFIVGSGVDTVRYTPAFVFGDGCKNVTAGGLAQLTSQRAVTVPALASLESYGIEIKQLGVETAARPCLASLSVDHNLRAAFAYVSATNVTKFRAANIGAASVASGDARAAVLPIVDTRFSGRWGAFAVDVPSLANGESYVHAAQTTYGSKIGDIILPVLGADALGIMFGCNVVTDGQTTIHAHNFSGVTTNLASGSVRLFRLNNFDFENAFSFSGQVVEAGGTYTYTNPIAGVRRGDFGVTSFFGDLKGVMITAYVDSDSSMKVVLYNGTGVSQTLAAGGFRIAAYKKAQA